MNASTLEDPRQELRSMIADSANRLLKDAVTEAGRLSFEETGEDPALWSDIEAAGLDQALSGDPTESDSLTLADVFELVYAVGFWQVPAPLLETLLAREVLAHCGLDAPDGPLTVYCPVDDASGWQKESGQWMLGGSLKAVPWARSCSHLLAVDPDAKVGLFSLEGKRVTHDHNLAREPRDTVTVSQAWAREAQGQLVGLSAQTLLARLALLRSIALVGAMDSALQRTITHLNERVQFGRALSKFQVIQHSVAELAGEIATARTACRVAAQSSLGSLGDIAQAHRFLFDASVAKVRASAAASACAKATHQLHGAIGFTHEHALRHATQRMWSWRAEAGSQSYWAAALGRAAIDAGSEEFWARLTRHGLTPLARHTG